MRINQVVKTLVFSDLVFNAALGLASPIFAIFITNHIKGGSVTVVGFAVGIYWLVKSLLQVPFAHWLDKNHGEIDDFWFLEAGLILMSLGTLCFSLAKSSWHIYIIQAVNAMAMAMAIPAWCGIFTRHIDKGREAFDWSLESTGIGLGAGIAGILGGLYVAHFSFQSLYILAGALALVGGLIPLLVRNKMTPSSKHNLPPTTIRRVE